MLDAPAERFAVPALERPLEDVERLAVGPIADGVDAQLIAVLEREARGPPISSTVVVLRPCRPGLSA